MSWKDKWIFWNISNFWTFEGLGRHCRQCTVWRRKAKYKVATRRLTSSAPSLAFKTLESSPLLQYSIYRVSKVDCQHRPAFQLHPYLSSRFFASWAACCLPVSSFDHCFIHVSPPSFLSSFSPLCHQLPQPGLSTFPRAVRQEVRMNHVSKLDKKNCARGWSRSMGGVASTSHTFFFGQLCCRLSTVHAIFARIMYYTKRWCFCDMEFSVL